MKFFPRMIRLQKAIAPAALLAVLFMAASAHSQAAAPSANDAVNITFTGATRFNEGQLRTGLADQIEAIRESGLNGASADDTAFFLGLFYHKNGYPLAEVKYRIAPGSKLLLDITEGDPAIVQDVNFTGNQSVPSNVLRDYLLGATRERFSRLKQGVPYIAADIETGSERIRGYYQSEGFLDSIIDPTETTFSADKTRVLVKITVHEGRQYRFGKLNFTGDLVFYPQKELLDELAPFSNKPYTQTQLINLQRKVLYFYRSRGYFDAKIDVQADPKAAKDGLVAVNFTVASGNVYRFGGVHVTGLDRLRPGFLEKRFGKLRGKFYNPAKLDEVYQNMMRTGLFKTLRIASKPLPSGEVELDMEVEEAMAKEIGFSLGYGTFDGAIVGLHLADRDLFGSGRPVSATFEYSTRLLKGELTYTDPWFLDTPNSLKLRVYALNQDWDGYSKAEFGFRGELSRKLTKHFEATAFLLTRKVSITANGISADDLGITDYYVNSVGLSFTFDPREKTKIASRPARGLRMEASGELATEALGSTINFLRGTVGAAYYLPVKNTMLAFSAHGGIVHPLDGGEVPIDERFFNGGSNSVRSFAERDLGPRDTSGNPLGGETFTVFNAEYTFPIYGDLDGAVFADAGSIGRQVQDGIGELRYGIGSGLRYNLPIGPLRLDYGYNPTRKEGEAVGAVHFSFGFAF
jgi:outer membrane protein assembly complex protein YaeT